WIHAQERTRSTKYIGRVTLEIVINDHVDVLLSEFLAVVLYVACEAHGLSIKELVWILVAAGKSSSLFAILFQGKRFFKIPFVLAPCGEVMGMKGIHNFDGIPQHDDNLGGRRELPDRLGRDLGRQIVDRCFADAFFFLSGGKQVEIIAFVSNGAAAGHVGVEIMRLLIFRQEYVRVLTKVRIKSCRAATWRSDDKEVGPGRTCFLHG